MGNEESNLANKEPLMLRSSSGDMDIVEQRNVIKKIVTKLDNENVAKDIIGYPKAPPSLRLWGGATVQNNDMKAVLPWLDWAYNSVKNNA